MHEVLVNRLGGLSLPRKCVVRLTDRPDMTLDFYRGHQTTIQQQQQQQQKIEKLNFIGTREQNKSFTNDFVKLRMLEQLGPVVLLGEGVKIS